MEKFRRNSGENYQARKKEPQKVIESTDYVFTESLFRAEIIKGQNRMFWFENKVKIYRAGKWHIEDYFLTAIIKYIG